MKVLVCIKAVPLPESTFRINESGDFYDESSFKYQVNEYDLYAMEEAVRIKERLGDVEITGIMAGQRARQEQLRKALAMGADHGVLIDDSESPLRDAFSTASAIAAFAKDKYFDLLLCGVMSEDLMQAQTGPMLAELLGMSCATTAVSCDLSGGGSEAGPSVTCERELEGGINEKVELGLPAVITVQSGINTPRYASLTNVLRVKEMDIPIIHLGEIWSGKPKDKPLGVVFPEPAGWCEFLEGDSDAAASELIKRIRSLTQVI